MHPVDSRSRTTVTGSTARARRVLLADGLVVAASGIGIALAAPWVGRLLALPEDWARWAVVGTGVGFLGYGGWLSARVWSTPPGWGLVCAIAGLNTAFTVACLLLAGLTGGTLGIAARLTLIAVAVAVAGFAAAQFQVLRRMGPTED